MKLKPLVLLIVLALAGVAVAASVYTEAYQPLGQAPAAAIGAALSSPDSAVLDTPVRARSTHGDPRVVVAPSASVNGAIACFEVVVYQRPVASSTTTFATIALVQTITCGWVDSTSGRWTSTDGYLIAPTLGCQLYDVRLRSISAGNVTWSSWSLGPSTTLAGQASE